MNKLNVIVGNIVSDELLKGHDCIVNPTNPRMVCGSGVSGAIFHKAGVQELENYTQKRYGISYFTTDNLMKVGDVRITPGYNLGIDIAFVQGPKEYDYDDHEMAIKALLDTYKGMISEINSKSYKKILCPSLGTGSYGFSHEDTAKRVMSTLKESLKDKSLEVTLVLYDSKDLHYYEEK